MIELGPAGRVIAFAGVVSFASPCVLHAEGESDDEEYEERRRRLSGTE